ncbi:MAG: MarR family winged helix-turn-helix transcriptional regulator [Anaerolineae bacterium]
MQDTQEDRDHIHARIQQQVKALFHLEDTTGVELFSSLHRVSQLGEMLELHQFEGQELSAPRWRLLMHLFISEQIQAQALTPTELSRFQQVRKNTISSLLRGLEDQGYVRRELDPNDLRVFHIHLTEAGRQVILETAPKRLEGLNRMLGDMSVNEVQQLIHLLTRLRHSLEDQASRVPGDPACG